MMVVVSKVDLLNLISKVFSIIPAKPTMPILANVLLEAKNNQLILSATDRTTSMQCSALATVSSEGAITLPAKRLFSLIKELTAPQVKIQVSGAIAEISAGSSIFKLNGMRKDDFPLFPEMAGATQLSLPSLTLKEALTKAAFSAAKNSLYYILNGVQLKIADKIATLTGTDGKRISKISMDINLDAPLIASYPIPLKAVDELIKILDESDEKVSLFLASDKVFLERGTTILATNLLSGQYPDIKKAIPDDNPISLVLHREELTSLLRQVAVFTSEESASVRFIFKEGELELMAANSEIGEGSVSMPVNYTGERLEMAFNPFHFLDILRHSKCETLLFAVKDPYTAGIVKDSTSSLFVMMPMRLKEPAEQPATV